MYNNKIDQVNIKLAEIESQKEKDSKFRKELNDFKTEIHTDQLMDDFEPEIFEKLVEKVIIGEINEEGVVNPFTIKFVYRTGWSDKKEGKISKIDRRKKNSISQYSDEGIDVSQNSNVNVAGNRGGMRRSAARRLPGCRERQNAVRYV